MKDRDVGTLIYDQEERNARPQAEAELLPVREAVQVGARGEGALQMRTLGIVLIVLCAASSSKTAETCINMHSVVSINEQWWVSCKTVAIDKRGTDLCNFTHDIYKKALR